MLELNRPRPSRAIAPAMLLYFAFVATLNLCVGYALGAHFGGLPEIRVRRREPDPCEPLVRPAEKPREQPAAISPAPEPEAPVEPPDPARPTPPSQQEILAGLAAFQQQMARMGQELREAEDDAESFGQHAKGMQKANHAYLETAQHQVELLDPNEQLHRSVATSAEQVGKISEEFDSIIEEGLADEQARACLLAKTEELNEKVCEVQQVLVASPDPTDAPRDEASMMATLSSLLTRLDDLLAAPESPTTGLAALVRADPPAEKGADRALLEGVNAKMATLLQDAFEKPQDAASIGDGQFMVLFDEADLSAVTEQVETFRRQIAETTFVRGEEHIHTTITCAIADLPGANSREEIKRRLEEAMAESGRLGNNRTFHHDGTFPTPIVPEDNSVTPRTVEF